MAKESLISAGMAPEIENGPARAEQLPHLEPSDAEVARRLIAVQYLVSADGLKNAGLQRIAQALNDPAPEIRFGALLATDHKLSTEELRQAGLPRLLFDRLTKEEWFFNRYLLYRILDRTRLGYLEREKTQLLSGLLSLEVPSLFGYALNLCRGVKLIGDHQVYPLLCRRLDAVPPKEETARRQLVQGLVAANFEPNTELLPQVLSVIRERYSGELRVVAGGLLREISNIRDPDLSPEPCDLAPQSHRRLESDASITLAGFRAGLYEELFPPIPILSEVRDPPELRYCLESAEAFAATAVRVN